MKRIVITVLLGALAAFIAHFFLPVHLKPSQPLDANVYTNATDYMSPPKTNKLGDFIEGSELWTNSGGSVFAVSWHEDTNPPVMKMTMMTSFGREDWWTNGCKTMILCQDGYKFTNFCDAQDTNFEVTWFYAGARTNWFELEIEPETITPIMTNAPVQQTNYVGVVVDLADVVLAILSRTNVATNVLCEGDPRTPGFVIFRHNF